MSTKSSSSPEINMPVVLSTLLLYSLRTIVIYCYQLIFKDGLIESDELISNSNDISHCSESLIDEETRETEVFPILSSFNIEIITISDTESETD